MLFDKKREMLKINLYVIFLCLLLLELSFGILWLKFYPFKIVDSTKVNRVTSSPRKVSKEQEAQLQRYLQTKALLF